MKKNYESLWNSIIIIKSNHWPHESFCLALWRVSSYILLQHNICLIISNIFHIIIEIPFTWALITDNLFFLVAVTFRVYVILFEYIVQLVRIYNIITHIYTYYYHIIQCASVRFRVPEIFSLRVSRSIQQLYNF